MAIAHVCIACGWDLARVRPQREPRYGLNLITCPKCGSHTCRRKHSVWQGWRRAKRMIIALLTLGGRLFITALLTFLNVMASLMLLAMWREFDQRGHLDSAAGIFLAFALGLLAPLTGVWLTAAFEHVPRWKMWIGWLVWIGAIVLVISLHGPLGDDLDPRGWGEPEGSFVWIMRGVIWVVVPATMGAAILLIAALPGIAIGRGLSWLTRLARRAGWRAQYRRRHLVKNVSWE